MERPALLTSTSTPPWSRRIESTASATASVSARSAGWAHASPPAASISAAKAARRSSDRATRTTSAPAAARRRAAAAPIPVDAPVTTTTDPPTTTGAGRLRRVDPPAADQRSLPRIPAPSRHVRTSCVDRRSYPAVSALTPRLILPGRAQHTTFGSLVWLCLRPIVANQQPSERLKPTTFAHDGNPAPAGADGGRGVRSPADSMWVREH